MKLSVVIPTWCERPRIRQLVLACRDVADEVVVCDAASPDGTAKEARRSGARVIACRKGRGPQQNAGAHLSEGDVLLFVHADTSLPSNARTVIEHALSDKSIVGGNFRLRFEPQTLAARLYAFGNHLRRRAFRVYYGDSCIFVRRSIFDELGGFRDYPIFEDQEFVSRLERAGPTHYETRVEICTSSRRFAERPWKTLAIWGALQALYGLGVSPERLALLYADER